MVVEVNSVLDNEDEVITTHVYHTEEEKVLILLMLNRLLNSSHVTQVVITKRGEHHA
jgi:hypothetical protein